MKKAIFEIEFDEKGGSLAEAFGLTLLKLA